MTGPRLLRLGGAALASLWLAASCASGNGDPGPSADPTTTTTSVEDAVLDAYRAFWDGFFAAADPPDPNHRALSEVATGEQLDRLRELFTERRTEGIAARRGETRQHPQLIGVSETRATVADCWLDEGVMVDAETGEVISDRKVWLEGEFTLERDGGTWKVASNAITERREDRPCDA